jgi:exonuclease III
MKKYILILFTAFQAFPSFSQKTITIAFYNVENLFDTINSKKTDDEDFTPKGKLKWDTEKYFNKLDHISKVIKELGGIDGPDVLGLSEIENKSVLKDLTSMPLLKPYNYNIVHFESPDERGIDVALIYKSKSLKLISSKAIRIDFPDDAKDRTRDLLLVSMKKDKKDTIYIIVNHFPSRSGGTEATEPKRVFVASKCRTILDSILSINYKSKIILMGDFNDEPTDKSIKEGLKCKFNKNEVSWNELYNPMMDLKAKGEGTIMFKKKLELIDQFMVSEGLLSENSKIHYIPNSATIYNPEYLKETEEAFKGSPFRTFAGKKYLNGFSDHFPIYMKISY